jgi:co-chaperonin GroES (HSP10)
MAKSKLVTPDGISIATVTQSVTPKIKGVTPCGSQVLVEVLTQQEMLGTSLSISEDTPVNKDALQGYVVAVGPKFNGEDFGFKLGDRVLISGMGVPAPNYDECHRVRFLMEPYCIKSVLLEQ